MSSLSSLQKIEDYMNRDQARICVSSHPHLLIEGVAGSRKTDTMIRLGLRRHLLEKKNLLFLTQIGSVTDEIRQRVGSYLGKPIYKFGGSNHFLCEHEGSTIEIANFDAWVHRQLEDCQWPLLGSMGGFHHFKAKTLLDMCREEPEKIKGFSLKNGSYADEILIDECQDFEGLKAELLVEFLKLCPSVRSVFAGDKMQTLFEHSLMTEHPMTIFKRLDSNRFSLTKCFRCPKPHILFTNRILKKALLTHGCKEIVSINRQSVDKPFLFTHGSSSKTFEVHQSVQQILLMLETLCNHDATIVPSDVCFLMRKSNNQKIFDFLRVELEKFWSQKGFSNSVIHFATQHDGYRTPIQWEFAENKSCLISIHGDKGKGHKVVFFLGFSQGTLPEECALHKPKELIYDSLLNVALTRSTKYLMIGFHYALPSKYLSESLDELKNLYYCSWMVPKNTPKLYQRLASHITFPHPLFENHVPRARPILLPSLWPLSLKDTVRAFERVEDLLGFHPRIQTLKFGQKIKIKDASPDLISSTAGVMLWSMVHPDTFYEEINRLNKQPVLLTDNDRLICLVKDYQLNSLVGTSLYHEKLLEIKETAHVDILRPLEKTQGFVLPGWLRESLEKVKECGRKRTIPLELWIPLSLVFREIRGEHTSVSFQHNLPDFPVLPLLTNVQKFCNRLSSSLQFYNHHEIKANLSDEQKLFNLGFDPDQDPRIFEKGLTYGLISSSDLFDLDTQTLYFLKSSDAEIPKEWILHASICSALPISKGIDKIPQNISIVNFITGKIHSWERPNLGIKKVLERIMWEYPPDLINILYVANHRKLTKQTPKP